MSEYIGPTVKVACLALVAIAWHIIERRRDKP